LADKEKARLAAHDEEDPEAFAVLSTSSSSSSSNSSSGSASTSPMHERTLPDSPRTPTPDPLPRALFDHTPEYEAPSPHLSPRSPAAKEPRSAPSSEGTSSDEEDSSDSDSGSDAGDPDEVVEQTNEEYVVEKILAHRTRKKAKEYQVQWVGYPTPTWEPLRNIHSTLRKDYHVALAKAAAVKIKAAAVKIKSASATAASDISSPKQVSNARGHKHARVHTHKNTHTYTHTHTHTHTHIHTHIHTQ
jgi:hypothetical protein